MCSIFIWLEIIYVRPLSLLRSWMTSDVSFLWYFRVERPGHFRRREAWTLLSGEMRESCGVTYLAVWESLGTQGGTEGSPGAGGRSSGGTPGTRGGPQLAGDMLWVCLPSWGSPPSRWCSWAVRLPWAGRSCPAGTRQEGAGALAGSHSWLSQDHLCHQRPRSLSRPPTCYQAPWRRSLERRNSRS